MAKVFGNAGEVILNGLKDYVSEVDDKTFPQKELDKEKEVVIDEINSYKASVGGSGYYGGVQLFGKGFYALLKFHKDGPLPDASAQAGAYPARRRRFARHRGRDGLAL